MLKNISKLNMKNLNTDTTMGKFALFILGLFIIMIVLA